MSRVLFFLLLGIALYVLIRSMQRRNRPGSATKAGEEPTPQVMVSCARCGLHVPRQEALPLGDRYFCCEEHRRNPPSA